MSTNNQASAGLTRRNAIRAGVGTGLGLAAVAGLGQASVAAQATPASTAGQLTATKPTLTLEGAQAAVQAALAKAKEVKANEVVTVVDDAGTIKAFARMDGTPYTSIDYSEGKAYTAASFHASTSDLSKRFGSNPVYLGSFLNVPKVILLPGGTPIKVGSVTIGAVGCGGGSPDQDQACSDAGAAAVSRT